MISMHVDHFIDAPGFPIRYVQAIISPLVRIKRIYIFYSFSQIIVFESVILNDTTNTH